MTDSHAMLFEQLLQRLNAVCLPKSGSFRDGDELPEMVVIPSGGFMMGSPEDEPGRYRNEGPQHRVQVKRFAIGKYPVTQAQWEAVMGNNPSYFNRNIHGAHWGDYPVESMSWHDANHFAQRLSDKTEHRYRLPSEAEWEYACRGGMTTAYPWGETLNPQYAHFNCPDEAIGTSTVIGRPNGFGLCDMVGNVWELVEDDDHDTYDGAPTDGSAWKGSTHDVGEEVIKRGGAWDLPAEYLRCATRSWEDPDEGDNLTGFRIAMSLPQEKDAIYCVEAGMVDPDGEKLTLIYGDMSASDWNGGLPVMRFAKPKDGTLVVELLLSPETPDFAQLLTDSERQIKNLLLRMNCLPSWEYAKYRTGCGSNVYGEWHWGYVPDPNDTPSEPELSEAATDEPELAEVPPPMDTHQNFDSETASRDWKKPEDDGARRNQLRAEITTFREAVNRSETLFRTSATGWRRKRWLFVMVAVFMLFFGATGVLASVATIGMMMYIDPMGKASRQAVGAEICLILSKELAALLQNEPDNVDFMAGKLDALKSLRAEITHLQQDTEG